MDFIIEICFLIPSDTFIRSVMIVKYFKLNIEKYIVFILFELK